MSLYIDKEYLMKVSNRLEKFKQKDNYTWNCRCVLCGDSKKSKFKARGYFFRMKDNLVYTCHNCGETLSFGKFLERLDPQLYRNYQFDVYKNRSHSNTRKPDFSIVKQKPVFKPRPKKLEFFDMESIDLSPNDSEGRHYIESRLIPKEHWSNIYYTEDFRVFMDCNIPNHEKKLPEKEKRVLFPFYDEERNLLGFQGRTLVDSKVKYITIKMNDDSRKIYGLHSLDKSKPIIVVEGPIDSLFLPNCVATMDSSLYSVQSLIGDYEYIFVHDNESRNKDVIKQMERSISTDNKICIWPEGLIYKDINQMILNGIEQDAILDMVMSNLYEGMSAKVRLSEWRKINV